MHVVVSKLMAYHHAFASSTWVVQQTRTSNIDIANMINDIIIVEVEQP